MMAISDHSPAIPPAVEATLCVIRRRNLLRGVLATLLLAGTVLLATMLLGMVLDWLFIVRASLVRFIFMLTALGLTVAVLAWRGTSLLRRQRRLAETALLLEQAVPALQERWSTVTEIAQSDDPEPLRGSAEMLDQVKAEAEQMCDFVPSGGVWFGPHWRPWAAAFTAAFALLGLLFTFASDATSTLLRRFWSPRSAVALTRLTAVTGDGVAARGEPILLEAAMAGRLRPNAELLIHEEGAKPQSVALTRLTEPANHFKYQLRSANKSFTYQFCAGDGQTPWHKITLVDRPRLVAIEFRVTPPAYSQLAEERRTDLPQRCRALEGSDFEVAFQANKPLQAAELKFEDQRVEPLQSGADGWLRFRVTLKDSFTFTPRLRDAHGLENINAPTCRMVVYADSPPTVEIKAPGDQLAVPPDAKVDIDFEARDDFGVDQAELKITIDRADGKTETRTYPIELAAQRGAKAIRQRAQLDLATLKLQHGDHLNYQVQVTDRRSLRGSDGTLPPEAANALAQGAVPNTTGTLTASDLPDEQIAPNDQAGTSTQTGEQATSPSPVSNEQAGIGNQPPGNQHPTQNQQPTSNQAALNGQPSAAMQQGQNLAANLTLATQSASDASAQSMASDNQSTSGAQLAKASPPGQAPRQTNQTPGQASRPSGPSQQALQPNQAQPANQTGQPGTSQQTTQANQSTPNGSQPGVNQPKANGGQPSQNGQPNADGQSAINGQQSASGQKSANGEQGANGQQTAGGQQNAGGQQASGDNPPKSSASHQTANGQPSTGGQPSAGGQEQVTAAQSGNGQKVKDSPQPSGNQTGQTKPSSGASPTGTPATSGNQTTSGTQGRTGQSGERQLAIGQDQLPTPKGATAATAAHPNTGDPAERITGGQARAGQPGQSGQGGNSQPFPFDRKLSQKKDQPTSTTKSASTPAPPNNMALRAGFGPMTASSRPMSIKVDQWAGSYDGQQRQKLQLDIDKYVERIAAALAAADRQTTAVLAEVRAGASWQAPQADRVHGARQSLDDSEKIITELVFKSQNTPYAFVGLQMKDIGTEHVRPAGVSLVRAGEDGHPSSDREADLAQAAYHIARARQRLADLVRHYEAVKREDNRNETILHATKMHQLFIEDMQQFLKSAEPTLNPRIPGSMVEVSDEFVKKLEERYKKARELMDELAKMMAQDPDLARRVSALANLKGRTLRDQLTLLTRRQQTQHETLDQWVKTQPEARGPLLEQLRQQQHDDKADLVKTADTLRYEYITWTPKKVAQAGPELSRGRLQLESIARGEHEAFSQLETGQPATSLKITQQTIAGLGTLSGILASAHGLENANGDLSIFTAKRMTEASELSSRETGWITKMRAIDQQKIHEIGAVELYRLMSDTRALGGKLTDLQPLLDELSPEVGKKAGELSAMVAETIPARQVQAGVSLKQERLFLANDQEAQALQSYQQAEAAFDELLTMVEEVQKKMPPPDPKDIPNPPSLDKLLAMLEQEMEACQKLGNAARLVNIATNFDWFMPDNNPLGGSGAMGMNGMGSGQGGVSALPPQARPQSAKMRPQDAQLAKMLAQAAQDYARQTEQAMREFVQGVQAPQQGDAPATPTQTAAQPAPEPKPQGRDWNVFASKLKNELAQGRDSDPPEAYRQAIDEYFKTIADQARP